MTAYQFNSRYYDPALEQIGDGLTPATAYGFAGGKWRTNLYRFFADFSAHIAGLVTSSIDGSNIFGHDVLSSATTIALTNASKRSVAITMTAATQAVRMPDATTIAKGEIWRTRNAGATHAWALQDNGGGLLVASVAAGDEVSLQCEANGTAAGTWRVLDTILGRRLGTAASQAAARTAIGIEGFHARNRVINGDMRVDQRNEGGAIVVNSATAKYGLDRWKLKGEGADGVFQAQRLTASPPSGFTHYQRFSVTTADAAIGASQGYYASQPIEGQNVSDLGFGGANPKFVTLSFWARASLTGIFSAVLTNSPNTRTYPFTFTIAAANTWEWKTVTIPGDTTGTWAVDHTAGMELLFDLGAGTSKRGAAGAWTGTTGILGVTGAVSLIGTLNATLDITGVQLEEGSTATPFERLLFPTALLQCNRYYLKSFPAGTVPANGLSVAGLIWGISDGAGHILGSWRFPVEIRVAPLTVVLYTGAGSGAVNGQWFNIDSGGASTAASAALGATGGAILGTGFANVRWTIHGTAEAEL